MKVNMKRQWCSLLISLAFLVLPSTLQAGKEELLSIQVREVKLREKPSFVGKPGHGVQYGTRVTVLERKDAWVKVEDNDGHNGWVHSSSLTKKKIKLKSKKSEKKKRLFTRSKKDKGLEQNEIALAGKGLAASSDVSSGKLNYEWVDKMEDFVIPEEKIQAFLEKQRAVGKPEGKEAEE